MSEDDASVKILHLINVFTVNAIAGVTCWAFSTFPRPIWKACTPGASKTGIGQTSI